MNQEKEIINPFSLSGKTALVTGASRGLGRAIALALGRAGADVVVTDLLIEDEDVDTEKLAEYSVLASYFKENDGVRTLATSHEIEAMGVKSLGMKMDVTSNESVGDVTRRIEEEFGCIDILVNNAAVMDNIALFEYQTAEGWERDINVNLTGSFICAKAVWQGMKNQKKGRIINVSSFTAESGAFAQPGYCASKAGLLGLTRSLALEGAKNGITVNAVLPGFISTEAVDLYQGAMKERILSRNPMKRMGTPDEVAAAVVFLVSDVASYINGASIPVTGGMDLLVF